MSNQTSVKPLRPRRLRAGLVLLGLSAFVIATGSVTAYRHYFRRPGELAANFIPADALAVITLDTNPAPDQVALFKRISDTIQDAKLTDQMNAAYSSMAEKSTLLQEARPYLSENYALALYEKAPKDMDGVLYIAVTDRAKIEEMLEKNGRKTDYRSVSYVKLTKENLCVQLRDGYLLVAGTPDAFVWVNGIRMARQRPITSLPEFQEAQENMPADASLRVFVAPKALRELQDMSKSAVSAQSKGQTIAMPTAAMPKWMAYSATVRDTGIAIDFRVPQDENAAPYLKTLAQIAAIRSDSLQRLPTGAYSVSTISQPGKYFNMVREMFATDKKTQRDINKTLAEMKKETGFGVEEDVVPAFNGDFTMAIYPDANHADGVMDAVLVADDANDADPAGLVEKARLWVEKASGEKKKSEAIRFIPTTRDGATFWYLDAHSQKGLSKGLDGMDPTKTPNEGRPLRPIRFEANPAVVKPETHPYLSEKTIAYAQVGKTFIMATSKAMLNRAVMAYTGHAPALTDDPTYADLQRSLTPGAQNYGLIDLGRIMERLQPELKKSLKGEDAELASDIIEMFGPKAGIAYSAKYDGRMSVGSMLIPLNYEKAARVMKRAFKKAGTAFDGRAAARVNMQFIANAEQSYKLANPQHEYTAIALGAAPNGPVPADWKRLADLNSPVFGPGDRTYKVELAAQTPACKDGDGVMQTVAEGSFSVASSVAEDGCFIPGVTAN